MYWLHVLGMESSVRFDGIPSGPTRGERGHGASNGSWWAPSSPDNCCVSRWTQSPARLSGPGTAQITGKGEARMAGQNGEAAEEPGEDQLSPAESAGPPPWPHLTTWDLSASMDKRKACGKEARSKAPRSSHAIFRPASHRRDPIDLLEEQTKDWLPELVAVRYRRMLASPFAYFGGSALAMTSDLASTPTSELTAQICGDANLSNFGVFVSP